MYIHTIGVHTHHFLRFQVRASRVRVSVSDKGLRSMLWLLLGLGLRLDIGS